MYDMYDIAIIGAGPAGSTLARLLGSRYKVLLVDKRQLGAGLEENLERKCCGGLVAPDAQKVLAELGLGLPQEVLASPQLFVVRTIDLQQRSERHYQRFYINVDRERFDRWLVSMVPGCVDNYFGTVFNSFERTEKCFKLKLFNKGREYHEEAGILIGADGASSRLRKLVFPYVPQPRKYIAIQEWFDMGKVLPYFSAIFDSEISDFYSWTIPKGRYLLLGAALKPGCNPLDKFDILKKKLEGYDFNFDKCIKREGAFVLRPETGKQIYTGDDQVALVGEAAGWISPSSAEGFSYAFRSAMALAESLEEGIHDFASRYRKLSQGIRLNILTKSLKSPFMYNPYIRKMVMMSGLQSMKIHKK